MQGAPFTIVEHSVKCMHREPGIQSTPLRLQEKLAAMSPAERAKWKARQEDKQKKKMLKFKFK